MKKFSIIKSLVILIVISLELSAVCFSQSVNKHEIDAQSQETILVGHGTRDGLMFGEFEISYKQEYENYNPENIFVEDIKVRLDSLRIIIVLGTWCGDSKEQVPRFLRLLDDMNFNSDSLTIIGVDRYKTAGELDIQWMKIERVPTFIVMKNGREKGRITETPNESLEKDLLKIIYQ